MATSKSAKIKAEMEKVKAKIADQQAKLKELEQKHREAENEEIVDIVRGMSVSLSGLLQAVKAASGNLGVPAKPQGFVGRGDATERADFGTLCPEGAERSLQRRDPKAEAKSEPKEEPVE